VIAAQPLRWVVLITDLDPTRGHEQGGTRRVLVVSYEAFHRSASMTVCPITAARGVVRYPHEVVIPVGEAGQSKPGVILCHQVRTISQLRVMGTVSPVGYLTDPGLRAQVRSALARHFGLDIPAGLDGATSTHAFKP
jgi:mRNA interferase MazF